MRKDSTLSYFEQRRPDAIEHLMPIVPNSPHRREIGTLSWTRSEGLTSWDDVIDSTIATSPDDAVYFLDSSFLHRHEIPAAVFSALLSKTVAIIPPIWSELRDWVDRPFANRDFRDILAAAKASTAPGVLFFEPSDWPEELRHTARYYISLLSARKYFSISLNRRSENSQDANVINDKIAAQLQRMAGDRGAVLAQKGLAEYGKANFTTDENLVVTAVIYAIKTGREVSILTRDRDVIEQFRKFNYLLDTHYRSNLIAESLSTTPENLIIGNVLSEDSQNSFGLTQRSILDLPRRFMEWLTPTNSKRIAVSCHRLAGEGRRMKIASLGFSASGDMLKLLNVKGRTGGRNYDFPDNRNCHLVVSPPFAPQLSGCAILAQDEDIHFGDFFGPRVDVEYAVQEIQRFRRTVVNCSAEQVPGGTPGMKLADFFLKERLMFCCEKDWSNFSWDDLSTAIRYFDNAAIFLVDGGVYESLPEVVRTILLERRPWWSTRIREASLARAHELLSIRDVKALAKIPGIDMKAEAPHDLGYGHYLALLALRKQFATIIRQRVRNDHGRECGIGEADLIAAHYGGERALRLAKHGEHLMHEADLFFGDELLVYGTIAGIMQGADVVFLTRDPAFMDQLAKLGSLLSADYLASQFGLRRHADAERILSSRGVRSGSVTDTLGHAIACRLPADLRGDLLPLNPYLINIQCWLLGSGTADSVRFAVSNICAERGMHNLLRVKAKTDGRNVDGLDGWNIRAGGDYGADTMITIWNDRMVPIGSADFPRDQRLDHRVGYVAAADMLRIHTNEEGVLPPWHE